MEALFHSIKHSVVYGQVTIDFSLSYCARKTLEIAVHPDSTVFVKAPAQSDIKFIEQKIINRARWILGQQKYFGQFHPGTPARCYVNGETHLYLGKQYRLKLIEGSEGSVALSRGFFHVTCRSKQTSNDIRKLLNQWYSEKAALRFAESLERCWQKFNSLGIDQPKLSIRRMQKRWGSLSSKGTVTLNTDLVRAPKECIDYVVLHELCHLKCHDHGLEFYALLNAVCPAWEKVKHKLELSLA